MGESTNITKQRLQLIKDNEAQRKRILKLDKEILDANEANSVLTNENGELEKIIKDLRNRFIKGGLNYIEHNGYVVGVVRMFSDSEYTFNQDVPKEIGTARYNVCPFYVMINRQLEIDKIKKARYDSII